VLMGHRYYDTRIGRFISQDPAGDGDNWYSYADNSPTNEVDPSGLDAVFSFPQDGPGSSAAGSPGYMNGAGSAEAGAYLDYSYSSGYWSRGAPTMMIYNGTQPADAIENPTYWVTSLNGMNQSMFASGPQRDPIDPDRGHGPQGTGKETDIHTNPRAGDKGNQNFGKRGYNSNPPGKREVARQLEKDAQRAAKDAAKAEREALLETEQRQAVAEAATAAEELELAEAAAAVDEALIVVGVIVK